MNLSSFALVFTSVTLSALAQTAFKHGVMRVPLADITGILAKVLGLLTSPFVLLGLTLYGFGAVLWLFALRQLDLSLAYPFVAMSFVMIVLSGIFVFNEPVNPSRLAGIVLIVAGLVVMARGG